MPGRLGPNKSARIDPDDQAAQINHSLVVDVACFQKLRASRLPCHFQPDLDFILRAANPSPSFHPPHLGTFPERGSPRGHLISHVALLLLYEYLIAM